MCLSKNCIIAKAEKINEIDLITLDKQNGQESEPGKQKLITDISLDDINCPEKYEKLSR